MSFKWLSNSIACLLLGLVMVCTVSVQALAFSPLDPACTNSASAAASTSPACQDKNNTSNPVSGPNGLIKKGANLIAFIAGIGAVVVVILGGFAFVTSGGKPDAVAK